MAAHTPKHTVAAVIAKMRGRAVKAVFIKTGLHDFLALSLSFTLMTISPLRRGTVVLPSGKVKLTLVSNIDLSLISLPCKFKAIDQNTAKKISIQMPLWSVGSNICR